MKDEADRGERPQGKLFGDSEDRKLSGDHEVRVGPKKADDGPGTPMGENIWVDMFRLPSSHPQSQIAQCSWEEMYRTKRVCSQVQGCWPFFVQNMGPDGGRVTRPDPAFASLGRDRRGWPF